jgi:hypothetical protein
MAFESGKRLPGTQFNSSPAKLQSERSDAKFVTPSLTAEVISIHTKKQSGKHSLSSHRFESVPTQDVLRSSPDRSELLDSLSTDTSDDMRTVGAVANQEQTLSFFAEVALPVARAISLGRLRNSQMGCFECKTGVVVDLVGTQFRARQSFR